MSLPSNVTDALNVLVADQDATAAALTDQAAKGQALADAQHAKDTSDANVAACVSKQANDLAATVTLLQSTYGPAPAAPAAQPAPPPPANAPAAPQTPAAGS